MEVSGQEMPVIKTLLNTTSVVKFLVNITIKEYHYHPQSGYSYVVNGWETKQRLELFHLLSESLKDHLRWI